MLLVWMDILVKVKEVSSQRHSLLSGCCSHLPLDRREIEVQVLLLASQGLADALRKGILALRLRKLLRRCVKAEVHCASRVLVRVGKLEGVAVCLRLVVSKRVNHLR